MSEVLDKLDNYANLYDFVKGEISSYHFDKWKNDVDEKDMKYLSKLVFDKNAEVLEAPITGGQHRAESGNISILVGGSMG